MASELKRARSGSIRWQGSLKIWYVNVTQNIYRSVLLEELRWLTLTLKSKLFLGCHISADPLPKKLVGLLRYTGANLMFHSLSNI